MPIASQYDARVIGAAARYDMQFRVPRRPRLRRGLVLTQKPGQVAFAGVIRPQIFQGAFADEHLPELISLCTGDRTTDDLAAELDLESDQVFDALALL